MKWVSLALGLACSCAQSVSRDDAPAQDAVAEAVDGSNDAAATSACGDRLLGGWPAVRHGFGFGRVVARSGGAVVQTMHPGQVAPLFEAYSRTASLDNHDSFTAIAGTSCVSFSMTAAAPGSVVSAISVTHGVTTTPLSPVGSAGDVYRFFDDTTGVAAGDIVSLTYTMPSGRHCAAISMPPEFSLMAPTASTLVGSDHSTLRTTTFRWSPQRGTVRIMVANYGNGPLVVSNYLLCDFDAQVGQATLPVEALSQVPQGFDWFVAVGLIERIFLQAESVPLEVYAERLALYWEFAN